MKTARSDRAEAAGDTSGAPRSLTRILALFDLLAYSKRHMSLSELSNAIGCPKSSLLVLLRPLTEKGYLMREKDNYFLGPRIFQFAQSILTNHPFESVLRGVMNDVVNQTGETILFAVRDGENVVYSSVIESPQPVRYVAQQGINRPLYCSASGLVMLAFDTPQEQDAYFQCTELKSLTPNSITDENELRGIISEIRRSGYASTVGTAHVDAAGFGVPVFRADGNLAGALVIGAPVERAKRNRKQYVAAAKTAADRLSRALGHRSGVVDETALH
ncbi:MULTISPECIES: IclR family transcriptional regulator [Rhodobacterales]|uniref:IclR family transcriptional regulator n=1 Tax=Rhodobacterales TaxID=204455 RepID=UPI000C8FE9E4|nr:IclR family transcriptional regulator [Heliomarina baculiformis]MAM24185.1 IclR family transcriptional regulator [Paracoccaceae bacterium]HCQ56755.1 IclR family transcriptional regulator [Sulfitobacter sp.]|tara:strand:- start:423 stop:1244 length:822 start_codon:yes stop_codon:yes gene_type:complete